MRGQEKVLKRIIHIYVEDIKGIKEYAHIRPKNITATAAAGGACCPSLTQYHCGVGHTQTLTGVPSRFALPAGDSPRGVFTVGIVSTVRTCRRRVRGGLCVCVSVSPCHSLNTIESFPRQSRWMCESHLTETPLKVQLPFWDFFNLTANWDISVFLYLSLIILLAVFRILTTVYFLSFLFVSVPENVFFLPKEVRHICPNKLTPKKFNCVIWCYSSNADKHLWSSFFYFYRTVSLMASQN